MTDGWITPTSRPPLTGDERFLGLEASVKDFWAFAMSNLQMNNVRGYLAEFLVARAVGMESARVEWDAYDVLTPDGIRVEVKSAGLLQAWDQRELSRVVFTSLTGRTWSARDGYSSEKTLNADVYVFAIQTAERHEEYVPLDLSQWTFYVVSREALASTDQSSIGLASLKRLAPEPVQFAQLAEAIRQSEPNPYRDR